MFQGFEEVMGKPGFLQTNVEQHHTFEPGLKKLQAFASDTKPEDYSFETLQGIIQSFSEPLQRHLHDEIATLLSMKPYDSATLLKVYKKCEAIAGKQDKVILLLLAMSPVALLTQTCRPLCRPWFLAFPTRRSRMATTGPLCHGSLPTSFITSLAASMLGLGGSYRAMRGGSRGHWRSLNDAGHCLTMDGGKPPSRTPEAWRFEREASLLRWIFQVLNHARREDY